MLEFVVLIDERFPLPKVISMTLELNFSWMSLSLGFKGQITSFMSEL